VLRGVPPVRAGKRGVKLLKEDGYSVGALTNSSKVYNDSWLSHKKMHGHFDIVMSSDEAGALKPSPDGILRICEKLKVKPKTAVYAGDSEVDMIAAKSAGCIPVGITSGATERRRMRDLGATYVFDSLNDFALWLRRGSKL
jgi:phosphoglycolate phosphatase-like HAD superfamily hydrolase